MTTVDEAFRSVTVAWPTLAIIADRLRNKNVNRLEIAEEIDRLIHHWPTVMQVACAYHAVCEREFSSQSMDQSYRNVERWYIASQNRYGAHLGIEHCDGKNRHNYRVEKATNGISRYERRCVVCGTISEKADWSDGKLAWSKA